MNIQEILKNPDLIDNMSTNDKTNIYFQLAKVKEDISKRLIEYKTKKELLEKQKLELQEALLKEAKVDDISKLTPYLTQLQTEYDEALKKQTEELNTILNEMGIII